MVDKTVGKYLEKLQESGAFILGYMASIRLLVIIITRLIIITITPLPYRIPYNKLSKFKT